MPDDMSLTLSNYGNGVAIIDRVNVSKHSADQSKSAVPALSASLNYEVTGIYFVQNEYYLRPGDNLLLAVALGKSGKANEALEDWNDALNGVRIRVGYRDILGNRFQHDRTIVTNPN